jgi:hypothetical protein
VELDIHGTPGPEHLRQYLQFMRREYDAVKIGSMTAPS